MPCPQAREVPTSREKEVRELLTSCSSSFHCSRRCTCLQCDEPTSAAERARRQLPVSVSGSAKVLHRCMLPTTAARRSQRLNHLCQL